MFPIVIVRAAITDKIESHSDWIGPNPTKKTRRIAANAAAFGPAERNAVIGVGAPS